MGKNHRHSKKQKSEKNKVHIKSKTKFLPKGQNVTNTAFKIKPIVLKEQLKERDSGSLSGKKQANIDELVTKLKHYNETVKAESCQELKEAVTVLPLEAIQKNLSVIIQNASALMQDRERKVRRASAKLLHAIFEKTSDDIVRPFFNYILTNLKCAMTNINKHVQEDSLLFLDTILDHKSILIAENFDGFFPNFLMLISKLKSQSTERSLSLNLEGKITSVKWGVKVLTRLYGILNAVLQNRNNLEKCDNVFMTVQAKGTFFIPIYKNIFKTTDCLFSKNKTQTDLESHISNLTQLLHESWMEVVPEKNTKKNLSGEATVLGNEESIAVFYCVVNILRLIQDYVQNSENEQFLSESKTTKFLDYLMTNFPYSYNKKNLAIAKEFPKCFSFSHDPNCIEENLTIIYIFITLRVKKTKTCPRYQTVASYLHNCLTQYRLSTNSSSCLIKILKEILLNDINLCRKLGLDDSFMESVSTFYSGGRVSEKFRDDLLEILTNSRLEKHQSWMEKLPNFLVEKTVSAKVIDVILDLCRKNQKVIQDGLKKSLKNILDNLPVLVITDAVDVEMARKNLVSIFFYLPDLTPEDLEEINKFLLNSECGYSEHFKRILELRDMYKRL